MSDQAERLTIHDIMEEDSPHMYVYNRGSRNHGVIAHLLLTHVSEQSGAATTIELPMTNIPIDLADFAPKEELVKNPMIREQWMEGNIEFVSTANAKSILSRPGSRAESDRLRKNKTSRQRLGADNTFNRPNQEQIAADARAQQQNALGGLSATSGKDLDSSLQGVSPPIVQAMEDHTLESSERVALLSSLQGIMTDADRKYVRERSDDPEIRKIVAD